MFLSLLQQRTARAARFEARAAQHVDGRPPRLLPPHAARTAWPHRRYEESGDAARYVSAAVMVGKGGSRQPRSAGACLDAVAPATRACTAAFFMRRARAVGAAQLSFTDAVAGLYCLPRAARSNLRVLSANSSVQDGAVGGWGSTAGGDIAAAARGGAR